jgi:hypothetical protein
MCTTCVSSLVPLAGGSVTGLLTMGAVAGSAAVGSLVGFVKRTPDAADAVDGTEAAVTPSREA